MICSQSQSHVLSLPPELILHILDHLPLSALLIWHFQVCKTLRLASCSHGLALHKGYWSLAEHRQAASEVRLLCIPTSTTTTADEQQHQAKGTASVKDGPQTSPDADARLALRALQYAGLVRPAPSLSPLPVPRLSPSPTSLSLIGSRGVDGRLLRQLLREPLLASVQTVVKTGRLDKPIHEVWSPSAHLSQRTDLEHYHLDKATARHTPTLSDTTSSWALGLGIGGAHVHAHHDDDDTDALPLPEITQAVCIAGSKLSKRETIRGQGIQMGFEALCFASTTTPALGRVTRQLHIILEGAYDLDAAMEMEKLFASSRLQCRQCGNVIEFG